MNTKGINCMEMNEHQNKYENSDALINESIMEVESTWYCDWLAVIMYYAALHLVHKHCANRNNPVHPSSHSETLSQARKVKAGTRVHGELELLYNASLDVRYEAVFLDNENLGELKQSYEVIKNILA